MGKHWTVDDNLRIITEIAAYHDFGEGYNDVSAKLGLAYSFGKKSAPTRSKDSDNDGVYNNKDQCPNTPVGTQVDAKGCNIDADEDGVINSMDRCLNTPLGTSVDSYGCNADTDGDGILNAVDKCLKTPDGTQVGVKGCSLVLDTDQDGVLDSKDQCANTPITDKVDNVGCSIFMDSEVAVSLVVSFANNSSIVENPNDQQFQEFADFMNRYPHTESVIEGHASAPGNADYNMKISAKRAAAVRQLLVDQYNIDAKRLSSKGFGETQLIDQSNTRAAHEVNRRITAKVSATKREKVTKK